MRPLAGRPLRVKLTVLVVSLLGVGLLLSSLVATTALRGYLLERLDEQLTAGSRVFSGPERPLPFPPSEESTEPRPPSAFYVARIDASGTVTVVSTPTDGTLVPPVVDASAVASAAGTPETWPSADGGGSWRVLVTPVPGEETSVLAAIPMADLEDTVDRLVLLQLAIGLAVVVLAGLVGFLLVRRSLRPLDEMGATAHVIAEGDLSRRVSTEPTSAEVDELATSFNTMVDRIEASFAAQRASEQQARESEERMRRFVADAGHELRTPLTSIRGYAELMEQGAAPDPDVAVARIQDEAVRMGVLVDDLLLLARLDEQPVLRRDPVDLAQVCAAAVASMAVAAPDHLITLEIGDDLPRVSGDADRLRQVADNLLSNAVRYSPAGSPVAVDLGATGSEVCLRVTDRGQGLSADEAARVFDRLYRTDEARARVDGGTGLGLSIVDSIVRAHAGTVTVTSAAGEGSTFTVTLPSAEPDSP